MDSLDISNNKIHKTLRELMDYKRSDKGGKTNHHNFSNCYLEIFYKQRNRIKNFLVISLVTNNLNLASKIKKND